MRILLTGANGYIGMRLLPVLVESGHDVTCVVRESRRFHPKPDLRKKISLIDFDFLNHDNIESHFKEKEFDGDDLIEIQEIAVFAYFYTF